MADIDERVEFLLLRIRVDKQAASAALAALKEVQAAQEDLKASTTTGNGSSAIAAIRAESDANYKLAEAVNSVTDAEVRATKAAAEFNVEALRTDTLAALNANPPERAGGEGGGIASALGGRGGGLQTLARTAGAVGLGGVAEPLRVTADIAELTKKLPEMGAALAEAGVSVAGVGTAALVAAPLVVGLALALDNYNKSVEAGKKALSGALQAQTDYYAALSSKTTEQATQELTQLQSRAGALQSQKAELEGAIDGVWQDAVANFGDPLARALEAAGQLPTAQLKEQLSGVNAELTTNVDLQARYHEGLAAGNFATNDAAEAEKVLADARARTAIQTASTAGRGFTEDQQLLRGNLDQVNVALEKYSDQLGANAAELTALLASGDQSAEVRAREKQLIDENNVAIERRADILANVLPVVEAAAQAEFQLEASRQATLVLSGEMVKAEQAYATAQTNLNKATQAAAQGAVNASGTFDKAAAAALTNETNAIAQAESQAASQRADILQQAADEQTDAEIKAAADRGKIARTLRDALEKADRDFGRSSLAAIQSRNVVAFTLAKQQRDDEKADARKAAREQLDDLDATLKNEQRIRDRRAREQLDKIDAALNRQVADAQQKYQQATQIAKAAYQQQLADLQTNVATATAIKNAAYEAELLAVQNFNNRLIASANSLSASSGSGAIAGSVPNTGFLPSSTSGIRSGIGSLNVSINGVSKQQVLKEVGDAFDAFAGGR